MFAPGRVELDDVEAGLDGLLEVVLEGQQSCGVSRCGLSHRGGRRRRPSKPFLRRTGVSCVTGLLASYRAVANAGKTTRSAKSRETKRLEAMSPAPHDDRRIMQLVDVALV